MSRHDDALLITAHLASPLAGDAPQLDALLEYLLSLHHHKGVPGYKIDRSLPAPSQAEIPIPIPRRTLGEWEVALCSDPIYPACAEEYVDHVNKRIAVEEAAMLAPGRRLVVSTTNSWTKSYRLPLRIRRIDRVRWFTVGRPSRVLRVLRRATSIGKKISVGYGRVASWEADPIVRDLSWFAPSDSAPVLMRTLPVGAWLPPGLVGARKDYGAAVPPYWHPGRYTEIVRPA